MLLKTATILILPKPYFFEREARQHFIMVVQLLRFSDLFDFGLSISRFSFPCWVHIFSGEGKGWTCSKAIETPIVSRSCTAL